MNKKEDEKTPLFRNGLGSAQSQKKLAQGGKIAHVL